MLLLILYLPLIGAFVSGSFGFLIGRAGSFLVSTTSLVVSFFISIFFLFDVLFYYDVHYISLATWIDSGTLSVG